MENQNVEVAKDTSRRGFALMTPEQRSRIASLGGKAVQKRGTAHQFSTAEAIAAGKLRAQGAREKSSESQNSSK